MMLTQARRLALAAGRVGGWCRRLVERDRCVYLDFRAAPEQWFDGAARWSTVNRTRIDRSLLRLPLRREGPHPPAT